MNRGVDVGDLDVPGAVERLGQAARDIGARTQQTLAGRTATGPERRGSAAPPTGVPAWYRFALMPPPVQSATVLAAGAEAAIPPMAMAIMGAAAIAAAHPPATSSRVDGNRTVTIFTSRSLQLSLGLARSADCK